MFVGRLFLPRSRPMRYTFRKYIAAFASWLGVARVGDSPNLSAVSEHVTAQSGVSTEVILLEHATGDVGNIYGNCMEIVVNCAVLRADLASINVGRRTNIICADTANCFAAECADHAVTSSDGGCNL